MSDHRTEQAVIHATKKWLNDVIVALDFCPFAGREVKRDSIRFRVAHEQQTEECLLNLIEECQFLDAHPETETTLLIFPQAFAHFDDYLDFLELANALMHDQGYEGIYQLASFHPQYRFEDSEEDDPANYTNRSPYPMLHLIREASIETALKHHPDPEQIPERNVKLARELGLEKMRELLEKCRQDDGG